MLRCSRCTAEWPDDDTVCGDCDTPLASPDPASFDWVILICTACGTAHPADTKFCTECGSAIGAPVGVGAQTETVARATTASAASPDAAAWGPPPPEGPAERSTPVSVAAAIPLPGPAIDSSAAPSPSRAPDVVRAGSLASTSPITQSATTPDLAWEYKHVTASTLDLAGLAQHLDQLGRDGWELVGFTIRRDRSGRDVQR